MYQRILVPLDGSKVGESALPYVENLVSKLSPEVTSEVILFQILSPIHPQVVAGYEMVNILYTEQEIQHARIQAISYLDEVGERLRKLGVKVLANVAFGDPAEEIVRMADEIDADLIAMSTHGRSGINRWVFGSVTDEVLRREGKIPILVVRAPQAS
jgi:nucleotide-binding universal stress UspA family protein